MLRVLVERLSCFLGELFLSLGPLQQKLILESPDRQNLWSRPYPLRCPQGYSSRRRIHPYLGHQALWPPNFRIQHRSYGNALLQARPEGNEAIHSRSWATMGRIWRQPPCSPQAGDHWPSHYNDIHSARRHRAKHRAWLRPQELRRRSQERHGQRQSLSFRIGICTNLHFRRITYGLENKTLSCCNHRQAFSGNPIEEKER